MKLTEKKYYLESKSDFDSKHKLNTSKKRVPEEILEQIEAGVTSEQLDAIAKEFPVYKYMTQITIHGSFNELKNNYVYGYMNVFQNKNKSIGIRYNAIDEEKRQRIAQKLKYAGIKYNRTSSDVKFSKIIPIHDKTKLDQKLKEITELYNRIDTSLIYGSKNLIGGSYMGVYYIIMELAINSIYEEDINTFISKIITDEEIKLIEERERAEDEEREKRWEKERREQEEKRKKQKENNTDYKHLHDKHNKYIGDAKEGLFIKPFFNYKDELKFKAMFVYKPKGKKLFRANEMEYSTIEESLDFLNKKMQGWNDKKITRLKAYEILQP